MRFIDNSILEDCSAADERLSWFCYNLDFMSDFFIDLRVFVEDSIREALK
jgi:hypothetical protein